MAFVAALVIDLFLPDVHSLKEKRAVVKPIVEGARRRYHVAAGEVDHHDKWQRAQLAMAAVAASERHCADILDEVERFVWSFPEIEVVNVDRRWLDG